MPNDETALERQVRMLSEALTTQVDNLTMALKPPGKRPSFTAQLSQQESLAFWREHRYSELGKKALLQMEPEAILELDNALSKAAERDMAGPPQ